MLICAISDTHKSYRKVVIPKCDVLIFGGDMDCYRYDIELEDFNEWLGSLKQAKKIICIGGNHDGLLEDLGYGSICKILTNAIYLENNEVVIDGIKFWGSPITPEFNKWSFMKQRGYEIAQYWRRIPEDVDVLITHGPAFNIMDQTPMANGDLGERVGCLDLAKRIKELPNLKLHIFGHIHFSYGVKKIGDTTFINASLMDEEYNLTNSPIIIKI